MIGQRTCTEDDPVTKKVTVDIGRNSAIFRYWRDLRNGQERSAAEKRKHTGSGWAISVLCALKLRNRGKSWQLILLDDARGWLCVPKTLSELNRLSWRNDRAALSHSGRLGLTI